MNQQLIKFLLVEDDDTHAHLVTRSLAKSRVANQVHRVTDGAEAIEFLKRQGKYANQVRPDDPDLKTIPVVVMTTSDAESDRAKAYQHHANSYVVKPVDFEKFRLLVNDLCLYWGVWNEIPGMDKN